MNISTSTAIIDLIARLKKLHITMQLVNEQLKINAPKGTLSPQLLNEIKERKEEIIDLLRNTQTNTNSNYASIEPVEKKNYYISSPAQKRMFVLHQMDRESIAYNIPRVFHVSGETGPDKLETVFDKLIKRHESLRTSFHMIDNEPVQRIHDEVEFEIEPLEGRGDPPWSSFIRPFDLSRAPLIRVGLLKKAEAEYIMVVDLHHIISDGVSLSILTGDFFSLYHGRHLEPMRIQYKDFSQWQNSDKEKEKIKKQENYWLNELAGELPVLNLLTDFPRPPIQSFAGSSLRCQLPVEVINELKRIAVTGGMTLYMVLLAIYNVLLAKLTGREDIIVGTPTAGRRHAGLEKIIGMFINTLALRNYPEGHKKFIDFLADIKERTLEAFENQEYQFEDLVEKVLVERDVSRNPIFDTVFALHNIEDRVKELPPLQVGVESSQLHMKSYEIESGISKFDLNLTCIEAEEKLSCMFEYCTKLFKKETIQRFVNHFKQVVSTIIEDRNREICRLEIITEAEKKQILAEFNDATSQFPKEKTVLQLFEEQAAGIGDRIAVVGMGQTFTYRVLNKIAGQLAYRLRETGIQPNTIVGLLVERSLEMIAAILGTWKMGCAYLPLNPKNPAERNYFMLKDCHVKVLLTSIPTYNLEKQKTNCQLSIVNCQLLMNETFQHSLFKINIHQSDIAYVIYTSGSTGNPKGVLITHENLSPLLHWGYQNLGIGENDRALQNLSYYFDWSVWEMFIVLTTGASLYMVSENILLDAAACVDFINRHRLTVLHITPTQYRYIVKSPAVPVTLRYLFIGAEKLTYDLVERSFASVSGTCRVLNMYGPTEATIISAVLEIHRECLEKFKSLNSIPIGRPAGNTTLLILDKYRNLCPINIPGELYIGGDGLSQGYLNNPELTNERFIFTRVAFEKAPLAPPKLLIIHHSPLTTHHSPLYKTGDLARWLSDGPPAGGASGGVIEYLGRLDEQVKIRGFRIELGEIESFLVKREEIKEAVVIDWEGENKEKYLCAYIVFKSGTEENINGLKDYLTQNLPNYMIPSFFIKIEKIPLNANGKIDRKALPLPALTGKGKEEYTAPGNETEKKLAQIWSDILGIPGDKISIDSNFFELGGHSLKASIMLSQIKAQLNCTFALVEIFTKPTPRELAAYILSFPGINSTASLQDENLVLLKKGTESGKHLYMVHAGSGDVEEYIEFFENLGRLEPGLNGWGIRFDQLKNGCPQNITVEALAARYIEKIKKIQNKGPYMIAGWSIGGTIAFEMTRQLETLNEATAFLALVDTPNPQVDLTSQTQDFTLETELSRLKEIIPGLANHNKIENITDIEQLWFLIADYLEDLPFDTGKLRAVIPGYVIQTLPNIDQLNHRDLIFNINRVRTLNNARNRYIPSGKIRTPMYFYGSNEKGKIYAEAWKDYCAFQKYNELETDHYNMFKMPHAAVLAKLFNRGIQ